MKRPTPPYTSLEVVKIGLFGFTEFPFPSKLSSDGEKIRSFFMGLSDNEQLELLNRSHSYDTFYHNVSNRMDVTEAGKSVAK